MSNIVLPHTWVPLEVPTAANWNANEQEIQTKFNTFAFQLDGSKNMTGDLKFTDALYDIGKPGATRPRDIETSRDITVGRQLNVTGAIAVGGTNRVVLANDGVGGSQIWALGPSAVVRGGLKLILGRSDLSSSVEVLGFDPTTGKGTFSGDVLLAGNVFQLGSGNFSATWDAAGGAILQSFSSKPLRLNDSGNRVVIGSLLNAALHIGTEVTASVSNGDIVLGNSRAVRGVNSAGTDTKSLIFLNGSDNVIIANSGGAIIIGSPATVGSVGSGEVGLANAKSIRAANVAGSTTYGLIYLDGNDRVQIDTNGRGVLFGTSVTTGMGAGDLVVQNSKYLRSVNNAGTGLVAMVGVNSLDQIELAVGGQDIRWGRAVVSLGGGAAATLGAIGGSGPTVAAQNCWLRVITSTGVAVWLPVWA